MLSIQTSTKLQRFFTTVVKLRIPWFPVVILTLLLIAGIFAPVIAPFDPREPDIWKGVERLGPLDSRENFLGVDVLGRDMFSRLVYGARISVFISVVSLVFGATIGTGLGIMSGYFGGKTDGVMMRVTDAVMGFPTILLALIIVAIQGGAGIQNVIIAIMATVWADFSRQVRGEVLSLKERDYVTLAAVAGMSASMIMIRHILPNVINTILIIISLRIGQTILLEASLSFLGVGVPPGEPAWGIMVAEGRNNLIDIWWLSLLPGLAITLVVIAMNLFGDWMRDTLDPKLRRT